MQIWSEWLEEPAEVPVVGGVRIALRDPAAWAARYHDAALASIAEAHLATPDAVQVLTELSAEGPKAEAMRFGDDWVEQGHVRRWVRDPDERTSRLEALLVALETPHLAKILAELAPAGGQATLELGSGAGELSALLAPRTDRLLVADLSLRAVFRSLRGCPGEAFGAVADAEDLSPFRDEVFDLVAAMNLVDLLDQPVSALAEASRVLRRGGRLLVSTPHPDLGSPTQHPEVLMRLLDELGFRVEAVLDGVPWVRDHGRELQVFLCQVVAATRL